MSQFLRRYGKLVFNLSIPVDERIKRVADRARSAGVNFNEWARGVLSERLAEIEAEIPKDRAS